MAVDESIADMSAPNVPLNLEAPKQEVRHNFFQDHFEEKDRIILLLVFILFLSFFMDFQARRHIDSQGTEAIEKTTGQIKEEVQSDLDREIEEAQKKLDAQYTNQKEKIPEIPIVKAPVKNILEQIAPLKRIKETIIESANQQQAVAIQEAKAAQAAEILSKSSSYAPLQEGPKNLERVMAQAMPRELSREIHKEVLPQDTIQHPAKTYNLYYIRFDGHQTRIISVPRKHTEGSLRLSQVLENLKKGPSSQERGLLNNFDQHIKIHSVKIIKGTALVDINSKIARMGPRIIQDRLEQLTHTLTQFHGIDSVSLLIDGKKVESLNGANISFARELRTQRPSYKLSEVL